MCRVYLRVQDVHYSDVVLGFDESASGAYTR